MIKSLATILAIGALAATPAFAAGGGGSWNSGFQPTYDNHANSNQGPIWQGGQQSYGYGTSNGSWNGGQQGQPMSNQGMNSPGMSYGSDELSQNTIQQVQDHLQRLGLYHGAIDGQWGPETSQAIAEFQGQHGLRPTGNLTLPTVERLGMLNGNANSNYT
ncbi:MAG: peptidoglycan-binding domain-containing protein [Acetobacteraceae bacterium]